MVQVKNNNTPTVIITRFSAIGDVAMTIPLLYSLAAENKNHKFIFVSQEFLRPIFTNMPSNIEFRGIKLGSTKAKNAIEKVKNSICNYMALLKFGCRLKKEYNVTAVADLHNETKSHFLTLPFLLGSAKVVRTESKRAERKSLIDPRNNDKKAIESIFDRQYAVYKKLGFSFVSHFESVFSNKKADITPYSSFLPQKGKDKWVGIAPFANHKGKIYPTEKMERVIEILSAQEDIRIFCFGNGKAEASIIDEWSRKFDKVHSLVGKSNFEGELRIMSHLDAMISMDSANMHLASLTNTPVFSIWGATSPLAGFLGWRQNPDNCIELSLQCRPCSIYGNKPCIYGDYRCMNIAPDDIAQKVLKHLQ